MSPINLREALDALAPEPTLDGGLFDRVAGGVRRRRRRAGTAVAAAVAVAMLASPLAIHAVSAPPRPRVPAAPADAANRAAAERDVATRIAAAPVPPGSHRLPGPPAGGPRIANPWFSDPGPNHVSRTEWFSYPGPVHDAYMLVGAAKFAGQEPSGGSGLPDFQVDWFWPDLLAHVVGRSARVTGVPTAGGVLLRVDTQAYWLPTRTPDLTIGPDVTSVTVTVHTKGVGMGDPTVPARTFGPTTITDPARVAAVVSLTNGLPMALPSQGGVTFCPNDVGGSMRVDFADRSGRLLDRLEMTLSGCASIRLTAADGTTAGLDGPVNETLDEAILPLLGLDWTWTR